MQNVATESVKKFSTIFASVNPLQNFYNHTGEKVPSLEELETKKTALLQERSVKNAEYQEQKKFIKDVEYARTTLLQFLENEKSVEQQKKRKRNDLE